MTSELRIRSGRDGDIVPVQALLGRLFETTYVPLIGAALAGALHERWHSRDALLAQLSLPDTSFLIAEERDGLIVGHAFASGQRSPALMVLRLYVAAPHQGRGIGGQLLAEIVARHPAAEHVRLFVLSGNAGALAFYAKQGFVITGETAEDGIRSMRLDRPLA